MHIEVLGIDRLGELTDLYNAESVTVPLADGVTAERFEEVIQFRDDRITQQAPQQDILVAIETDQIVGFSHLAIGRFPGPELRGDEDPGETGAIRYFAFPGRHRAIGQALLEALEEHFRKSNVRRILAFSNTTGYLFRRFAFGEVSDRRPHVLALFELNGYKTARGEVFLAANDFDVEEPHLGEGQFDVEVQRISEEPLEGLVVEVKEDGKGVGLCESHSHGQWGASIESDKTLVVRPLDIEEPYQGKGWGRFLLQKTFQEAHRIGYRHTVTSTDWRNYRAQMFYSSCGYDAMDTGYSFVKAV